MSSMQLMSHGLADDDGPQSKRTRFDVAIRGDEQRSNVPRTSNLKDPSILLTGHEGEVFTVKFSNDGTCFASAGFDHKILLWETFGDNDNFSNFKGHKGAVMEVHFSTDNLHLFSCSTDKTVRIWDMEDGTCLRKFANHTQIVNSVHPARRGPTLCVSGSDDGTILIHDIRAKEPVIKFVNLESYPICAVTFNDTADQVISAGTDNAVKIWDTRRGLVTTMFGHQDTITGLSLSPDGRHVVSNSADCTARIFDIQPFATGERCVKTLEGHQHNFEKNLLRCTWSKDGKRIAVGSSDRLAYVFQVSNKKIEYGLPGHQGSVNAVDFHPTEPIVLSGGSDKKVFLGEIQPSEDITNGL